MNRTFVIGIAALALSAATLPAAAHKAARHYGPAAVPQQAYGSGARVEEVLPNTPAARAGVRAGDVIVGIGGKAIGSYADLDSAVGASGGRALAIDVDRGGKRLHLRAAPTLTIIQGLYGSVDQRFVLGIAHTEFRFISCALEPDCE